MRKLEYKYPEKVVIGTRTYEEHRFQLANHYNMVECSLENAQKRLRDFIAKQELTFEQSMLLNRILHDIENAKVQHFNEGQEIIEISELDIIATTK